MGLKDNPSTGWTVIFFSIALLGVSGFSLAATEKHYSSHVEPHYPS